MAALAAIAPILTAGAAVVGAGAAIYSGFKQQEAAEAEAKQMEAMGRDKFAATQRDALEAKLAGRLAQSRIQAIAAASGGGAGLDAPTIVKLMTDTGERTQYAADVAMYGGTVQRDYAYASAGATRRGGTNSLIGSFLSATGTLAGGLGDALGQMD